MEEGVGEDEVAVRRGGWTGRVVIGGIVGIEERKGGIETEVTGGGALAVVRLRGDEGMIVAGTVTEEIGGIGGISEGVAAAVIIGTGLQVMEIADMVPVEETNDGGRFERCVCLAVVVVVVGCGQGGKQRNQDFDG